MGDMKAGGKRRKLSYLKNERNGRHEGGRQEAEETGVGAIFYSAFQIDELHRHNQSLVGRLHARFLLWSADMKTAVRKHIILHAGFRIAISIRI